MSDRIALAPWAEGASTFTAKAYCLTFSFVRQVYSLAIPLRRSAGARNESRHAGLHHRVEPKPLGDPVSNFIHRVLRQGGNVEVLLNSARRRRGGQEGGAALHGPRQRHLSRRLVHALSDARNDRVIKQPWLHRVSQRRKRQKEIGRA